jgi:hypothetical protein
MSRAKLVMLPSQEIEPESLPELELPFATVIDARKGAREDEDVLISALLVGGCTLFVCVGRGAEDLHDEIDEIREELGYLHVLTTFHGSEQADDVVALLNSVEPASVLALVEPASGLGQALTKAFG